MAIQSRTLHPLQAFRKIAVVPRHCASLTAKSAAMNATPPSGLSFDRPFGLDVVSDDSDRISLATCGRITRESLLGEPISDKLGEEVYRRTILLSLRDSDYMDSSGVSWLLQAHKRAQNAGGRLVVHSISPTIQAMLKILKLGLVLSLAEDEHAAEKLLDQEGGAA